MYQLLIPIFFAASVLAAGPVALPSEIKTCSRNDPQLNACLKSTIQSALSTLVAGSRSLGVLPIDPLQITSLGINQGEGPVAIVLGFTNLEILGISKLKLNDVKAKLNGDVKSLTLKVSTDEVLSLQGHYTIAGKVLVLPISGTGNSKIDLLGAEATITFTGKTGIIDGYEYLGFHQVDFNLDPRSVTLHFENLFNGDKALGDNMNEFLNKNWEEVWPELKTPVQNAFGSTFIEVANRIFTKVPYEKIFP